MSAALPRLSPLVLVAAVDALPGRLRKKLDDMATRAAGWPVTADGDRVTVQVDADTAVVLVVTDGAVRTDADAACGCLLAPNCLHRTAVLARCPVLDVESTAGSAADPESGQPPATPEPTNPDNTYQGSAHRHAAGTSRAEPDQADPGQADPKQADRKAAEPALTAAQLTAAGELWQAAVAVLCAGRAGAGVVTRTALIRAAHQARVHGLHRAASSARQCATRLQAAAESRPQYRLADLTDDLRELLDLTRRLRLPSQDGDPARELVGAARRAYATQGSLRLYGLCTLPVVAASGHAGVATYLVDRDSRIWTVVDLLPGDADRAATAGELTVRLGEATLTHRALARTGLIVSGATASATGRLGAGQAVKAVRADGAAWAGEPLARLWREPVDDQIRRAFAAIALPVQDRPSGGDLLFLRVRVTGSGRDGVHAVTPEGVQVVLVVAADHAELPYRENLRVLAAAEGAELLVVGQPDPQRRGTVLAQAVAPATGDTSVVLPAGWSGHADLGFDRLHRSHLRTGPAEPHEPVAPAGTTGVATVGDPALHLLRRQVERVVDGGRAVQALATTDEHRLRRARLDTGGDLVAALTAHARLRTRDVFGRIVGDDGTAFAEAWLATALYEQAAANAFAEASWLPGAAPLTDQALPHPVSATGPEG